MTDDPKIGDDRNGSANRSLRGSNQSGLRAYNQRLVLSLVYSHGNLTKTDIARMTGLSAQTGSVIMRELEAEDLIVKGEPVRGKVGQPSVPLSINPDGAFFFGLKVGRRSAELILVNFLGEPQAALRKSYPWPTPPLVIDFASNGIAEMLAGLPAEFRDRVAGVGIATPFELWNWTEQAEAPREQMDLWRGCDLRAELAAICHMPVYLQNDATAACAAELVFGKHPGLHDFLYLYIGTFVGGGVVLNGSIYSGRSGNAGALGPLPVAGPDGKPVQLIERASIMLLERMLKAAGLDPSPLWNSPDHWEGFEELADEWIGIVARGLAQAVVSAASIIDFEHVIIDGGLPVDVREKIVAATQAEVSLYDLRGLDVPGILPGTVGHLARALGAASLPLFDKYLIDRNARLGG
ncbi:transcriptional regulator/sugar kinase [Hoeflea sp. IMCC20628]|uniref:ROK family transcriptional regulator n=1 Tax=Hoeflea sp. IMCC20628 TaxID=1620421 RepID=UPI00063ABC00|nr:ROK family transcriptional regulator [Hoeflea sp. IMCC20628]AKI02057.1 transcriptional regulator/sugar kinase [Hoeflea sp. IMCC20628]